jgi:hypothetical protein
MGDDQVNIRLFLSIQLRCYYYKFISQDGYYSAFEFSLFSLLFLVGNPIKCNTAYFALINYVGIWRYMSRHIVKTSE